MVHDINLRWTSPVTPQRTSNGIVLALICLFLVAMMPILSNSRPSGSSALTFAVMFSVWQLIFSVPLFAWEATKTRTGLFSPRFPLQQRKRTILIGTATGVMFGLSSIIYVVAAERAGAVNAAIAMQAYPLFAILWETLFLRKSKSPVEIGLTLGLVGAMYFLATGGTLRMDGLSPWFLFALGVPLLWSIAHVLIREELTRTPITPVQVTFFRSLISALFLVGLLLILNPREFLSSLQFDFQIFALAMGLVYCIELIFWFHAVRHIDVSLASSIITPWPAVTMILAVLFLGDSLHTHQIVAFVLVAACIYGLLLVTVRRDRGGQPTTTCAT